MSDVLRTRAIRSLTRARILGLCLSAGIAIALAGCKSDNNTMVYENVADDPASEITDNEYYYLTESVKGERPDGPRHTLIRKLIADNKITRAEMNQYDAFVRRENAEVMAVLRDGFKRELRN
jgi:hypothetical protein